MGAGFGADCRQEFLKALKQEVDTLALGAKLGIMVGGVLWREPLSYCMTVPKKQLRAAEARSFPLPTSATNNAASEQLPRCGPREPTALTAAEPLNIAVTACAGGTEGGEPPKLLSGQVAKRRHLMQPFCAQYDAYCVLVDSG